MDRFGNKTGGRQKGTPNRINSNARQRLEELGCDPLEGMAKIALDPSAPAELRGRMFSDLAQYVYPKLKAVDHTFGGSDTLEMNVSGTELLSSRIASLASKLGAGSGDTKPE